MLDNILKNIDAKAKQTVENILKDTEEKILALEAKHKKNLSDKYAEKKSDLASKVHAEIEEFRQQTQQNAGFRLQDERNKIVEAVYRSSKDKIVELNDSDFKKIINGLLTFVPKGFKGSISAGKRTARLLKEAGTVKSDLEDEGFILKGADVEIDLSVSQVLKQNREKTDTEVIKILFS